MTIWSVPSLHSSALDLFRSSQQRLLRGTSLLARPEPDALIDGLVDFSVARIGFRASAELFQADQENFRSLLDIFA